VGGAFSLTGQGSFSANSFAYTTTYGANDDLSIVKGSHQLSFGGHYIVLGGKITLGEGAPPRRITIIAFDSLEKAQQWFNSPVAAAARAEAQKFAKIRSYIVEGVAN